mmetsp:Transcript_7168/g.17936  ORF Transcript_7168/g.17936 Transcript_7168/m.17936 type:complete len:247 (-) Transcript_7168:156-896(-)
MHLLGHRAILRAGLTDRNDADHASNERLLELFWWSHRHAHSIGSPPTPVRREQGTPRANQRGLGHGVHAHRIKFIVWRLLSSRHGQHGGVALPREPQVEHVAHCPLLTPLHRDPNGRADIRRRKIPLRNAFDVLGKIQSAAPCSRGRGDVAETERPDEDQRPVVPSRRWNRVFLFRHDCDEFTSNTETLEGQRVLVGVSHFFEPGRNTFHLPPTAEVTDAVESAAFKLDALQLEVQRWAPSAAVKY